jgi:hypothetical protein
MSSDIIKAKTTRSIAVEYQSFEESAIACSWGCENERERLLELRR